MGLFALMQAGAITITGMPLPEAPQWVEGPQRADFVSSAKGDVELTCQITPEGRLSPCQVDGEDPIGMGLGERALALAARFRMSPTLSTGESVGGYWRQSRMHFHAPPPPLPDGVRLIERPQWLARPNASDVVSYYPDRAQRMMVAGSATLQCQVQPDGTLGTCIVIDEDPAEYDFGAAALRLAALLRVAPRDESGQPVAGGVIRFPINFNLPN